MFIKHLDNGTADLFCHLKQQIFGFGNSNVTEKTDSMFPLPHSCKSRARRCKISSVVSLPSYFGGKEYTLLSKLVSYLPSRCAYTIQKWFSSFEKCMLSLLSICEHNLGKFVNIFQKVQICNLKTIYCLKNLTMYYWDKYVMVETL